VGLAPKLKSLGRMRGDLGLVVVVLGSLAGGCATVEYRVPPAEMQRLVQLPPDARGAEVRVVPASAALGPPLTAEQLAPPPPPVAAPPPVEAPPPAAVQVAPPPPPPDDTPVAVSVDVSPPPIVVASPRVVVRRPLPYPRPVVRAPIVRAPPVRAPAIHMHGGGGGGHHSAGGNIGGAVAVAALVILPIVAIAIIADASAKAAEARNFDGWVAVAPDHLVRLQYGGNLERLVPLTTLCPSDLVGVRFGILRETDGPISRRAGAAR
jgi:hypothetical protein